MVAPAQIFDDILNGLRAVRDQHHLVSINPNGGSLRGQAFDLSDPFEHDLLLHWITGEQKDGRNVYFHANPVKAGFSGTKASLNDISVCTHAQFDMDPDGDNTVPFETRRDMVKQKLRFVERNNPPSVIIDSGNGFNILWELDQPISVDEYQDANRRFNDALSPKEGTFNADRILKVPGTVAFNGGKKVRDKGYPEISQARLVRATNVTTNFSSLPSAGSGSSAATSQGPIPSGDHKQITIPWPNTVTAHEKKKLREVIQDNDELKRALKPGHHDGSQNLEWVAGACRRAGLDRLDYANTVFLADRSEAHRHVSAQDFPERALGRAWAEAGGVPAKEEFTALGEGKGVPPKKLDVKDIIGTTLPDQGDLLGKVFPVKRAYVEQWTLEGVRLLGGAQKSGKSWLFLQEAQAVAEGQADYLGMRVHRGRVLYAGLEDGDRRLADRLRALGVSPCQDIKYWKETWTQESGAGNLEVLENLHDLFPFDVVYIDTLKYWFGASGARFGTAYDQSVEDMKPLVKFCQAKHVALCLTTHLKKDKKGIDDWQDLFQGSIGFAATADTLTMLERQRGSDDAILHRSGRDLDNEDDIPIQWQNMPNAWVLSPFSVSAVVGAVSSRQGSTKQRIVQILMQSGKPSMPKSDVRLQINTSSSAFYKAITELETAGTIGNHGNDLFLL